MGKLADGLKERQPFDIADGAADFAQHEINFVIADIQKLFDLVGDMGDDLNGFAQIVTTPLFFQHGGIDPPGGYRICFARGHTCEAFVMPKVQIGFGPIVGYENLAVFKR